MRRRLADHGIAILITLLLFVIPFFWLPPGTMDLGGDSSRLYFYDPVSYLLHVALYGVVPVGQGAVEPNYFYIPFVGLLGLLKSIVGNPWVLISIFNSIKVAIGFLFMYLIIRNVLKHEKDTRISETLIQLAAVSGGLLYILSSVTPYLSVVWNRALTAHNQIFLNPLMFYLLLKFFLSRQANYLWIAILVSFIFSANFALTSAPAFFSFYPISLVFLVVYTKLGAKVNIRWRILLGGFVAFVGVHGFHLLPQLMSLFEPGSFSNTKVFSKEEMLAGGVGYFNATSGLGKVSYGLLLPTQLSSLSWTAIAPAAVLLLAYRFRAQVRSMFLVSVFFFPLLFLVTANMTGLGLELYRKLFLIPGFSMFRVFYERWMLVFVFYYSMLFGLSAASLILAKKKVGVLLVLAALVLIGLGGLPLIQGKLVNVTHWTTPESGVSWRMDPEYEKTLDVIRTLPDGKILTLPLTDAFHQVLYGTNNAAYVGTPTIGQLTGKKDFSGYQHLYPYPEDIRQFAKEGKYETLTEIFSLLGIRYIFHNSDPRIYDFPFDEFPNAYMKTAMPPTQAAYKEFISHLPVRKIYEQGTYNLYEFDAPVIRPLVYVADSIIEGTPAAILAPSKRSIYIDSKLCAQTKTKYLCDGTYVVPRVSLVVRELTPSQYKIHVRVEEGSGSKPWILVFLNKFHRNWRLTSDDGSIVPESNHMEVNGYANAWIINPTERPGVLEYVFTLRLISERYFYFGSVVSIVALVIVCVMLGKSWSAKT